MGIGADEGANPRIKPESGARIFELARQHCTAEQWGKWLSIPLELAAAAGDSELTEELVLAGASGDPVEAAIRGGQHDLIDSLVQKPGHSHLRLAATLGNEAVVSALLRRGAEPDPCGVFAYDEHSSTPLLLAARAGHAGVVGLLLDAGASAYRRLQSDDTVDENGSLTVETESALDLAAIGGHVNVIKAICQREPSIVNGATAESTGFTALHYAATHNQIGSIEALAAVGADLEAQDDVLGGTALFAAVESPDCRAATLLALLRHGASVDPVRFGDETPLHVAVEAGNEVAVKTLLSAGADPSLCLLSASTACYGVTTVCDLLRHGADVKTRRAFDGNTPLHLAAERCILDTVDALLRAGADETAVNGLGLTPAEVVGCRSEDHHPLLDSTRILLANAPRDRADRAWARRGFFVLCRAFPERVRLQRAPPSEMRGNEPCTAAAPPAIDTQLVSGANKREATANGGGDGGSSSSISSSSSSSSDNLQADRVSAAFRAAMVNLLGLEMDVIFRTVLEFL